MADLLPRTGKVGELPSLTAFGRCESELAAAGHERMQSTQQADFAQRLLDDDEHVLADVLRAFGPAVLTVMTRRYQNVLSETDMEDMLSIGLFRLWQNRHRFDSRKASLKVWFFRIVENAVRDVLRHGWQKARQLEVHSPLALTGSAHIESNGHADGLAADSSSPPTNSEPCEPGSVQSDLREIIADLPEAHRRIVLADAAAPDGTAAATLLGQELNLPASTVRVYRKRALDRIRKELTQRGHQLPPS